MYLKNKKVVLTGAGAGIGRELAKQLVEEGAFVVGLDLNQDFLNETETIISSDNFKAYQIDISNKKALEEFYKDYFKIHQEIDLIINNAGIIQKFVPVDELEEKDIERIMNVNFFAPLNIIRLFMKDLKKREESYIVNVSSMGGFFPFPGQTIYGASKAALKLFTEGLYSELLNTNIKVTIVYPGAIATNITANSNVEAMGSSEEESSFKALPAEDAAREIIKAIHKEKLEAYVGSDSKFMNKLYKFNPERAVKFIANKMNKMLEK